MRRGLGGRKGGGRGGGGGEGEGGRWVISVVRDRRRDGMKRGEVGGWRGDERGGGGDLGAPRSKGARGQGKICRLSGGEKICRISAIAHTESVDWREWFEP